MQKWLTDVLVRILIPLLLRIESKIERTIMDLTQFKQDVADLKEAVAAGFGLHGDSARKVASFSDQADA